MFRFLNFIVFCVLCISSSIWTPLKANAIVILAGQENPTDICRSHAKAMEDAFDLHELIRLIVELREYMTSTGCYFPRLTTFLEASRDALRREGFEIEDIAFDALWAEFARYEQSEGFPPKQIKHHKHHHHKKHKKEKDLKISSKMCM